MIDRLFKRPTPALGDAMVAAAATTAARVAREPRRQPGELSVGGRTIKYADLHSFYHQANQIFGDRLYDFSTTHQEPLILDCGAALRAARRMIVEVHVFGDGDDRVGTLLSQIEAQGFRYVLGDLHHADWKGSDPTPFGAVTTAKYYFTVFAWRPA